MRAMMMPMVFCCSLSAGGAAGDLRPQDLRCEYRRTPLGIEVPRPRLSWSLESERRGEVQTAYRILAARSERKLAAGRGDLWDSGKVASEQSIHIPYGGEPLGARQRCFWKVRVWDRDGKASPWSETTWWTTGPPDASGWAGKWIAAPADAAGATEPRALPLFRREFEVKGPVAGAYVSVCGLGHGEVRLNGQKVGDAVLDPGWTNYRKTCLYTAHDVTGLLVEGRNAIGVMLGNGMYNVTGGRYVKFTGSFGPPKMILQAEIEYADGRTERIASDERWRTAPGPITFSCTYGGEDHDARLEPPGWDRAGFDDSRWAAAAEVEGPGGRLVPQSAPAVKIMEVFRPVKVTEPEAGVYVYDLGQNFSGWPKITVQGPAGAQVRLTPGEVLTERGLVNQHWSGGPSFFSYTLRGGDPESWHPRFSYYGFRYVQVEGARPGPADAAGETAALLDLEGHFVHSSAERAGVFACSDPLINRIHAIIIAAIRSNLQSVVTDCPHREKLGWLEVPHLLGPAIIFNFEVPTLYAKVMRDMSESQLESGLVPDIAPEYTVFQGGFRDSASWGSACVAVPWLMYRRYGDARALEESYGVMRRYVDYLSGLASDHILSHGLGDWCDPGPQEYGASQNTPIPLTETAIYYHDIALVARAARLLGREEEADGYAALGSEVRAAFNRNFFDAETNRYGSGSQVSLAMPLELDLVPFDRRQAVLEQLVNDVRAHDNHLTAGDVGNRFLIQALASNGRSDVVYDMTSRTDDPSYGFQVAQGVTTLTEAWDPRRVFSQNHCMLGHIEEWFYNGLAGIDCDAAAVGFDRIIIRPQVVGGMEWVEGEYRSIRGRIRSCWKREGSMLKLEVTIPGNTSATVYVPATRPEEVTEGGLRAEGADGVSFLCSVPGAAVFRVGSGRYEFASRLPTGDEEP